MINSPKTLEAWINERGLLCDGWTVQTGGVLWRVSFKASNHRSAMAIIEKLRQSVDYTLEVGPKTAQYKFVVWFPVKPSA